MNRLLNAWMPNLGRVRVNLSICLPAAIWWVLPSPALAGRAPVLKAHPVRSSAGASSKTLSNRVNQVMGGSAIRRWLSRPLGIHPELLNHGEISSSMDVGAPFGYRLGLKVGLLDVLTVGVLAQWRDPELGLRWAPELGVALYRGEHLSLGLRYRYLFHASPDPIPEPEPVDPAQTQEDAQAQESDPTALPEPAFFRKTHYVAGSLVWSSGYVSAGLEAGAAYRRELDQGQSILDPHLFSMQWRPMTGVLMRLGNARWGVAFQAMVPSPEVSLRIEWRHALFSLVKRRDPLARALERAKARDRRLKAAKGSRPTKPPTGAGETLSEKPRT